MSTTTTTTTAPHQQFPTSVKPTDPSYIPRGPVTANLSFYTPPEDGSAPYNWVEPQPEGVPQRNFGAADHDVRINDIRGQESSFTLDRDAFQAFQNIPSEERDFNDEEHIKSVYYPEVEEFVLKNVPGAHKVVIFDHTIRRSNPDAPRAPVTRVHVDQTPKSTIARVRLHSPDEADELLKGRYRIINVWRPLNGPVQTSPLAFASAASVDDADLVGVEHRYPNRTGETAGVKHTDQQKWYYWSGMENSERLLLKCYDSEEKVDGQDVGQRVPHTAFVDPRSPEGAVGRESIEVRTLVYG
ncbi:MAG: hypothetical protein Q9227_003900 [Pyrenula ochraceoflavens]